jgi:signal transduction histidine kinase
MDVVTNASMPTGSLSAVASIVHDLRNPLAAIHSSAEMLIGSNLSHEQVHRIARNMHHASIRMRELLDEFFDLSTSDAAGVELSDIRELVQRAAAEIAVSAENQSVQVVQTVPEGVVIALNQHRIHRVLVNLFVNALEAMPNGGTIWISTIADQSFALIRVRDTGPGIAPEIRGRLFQPFATSGKASGVGLGLAFSRQAVIDHGGEMWAESSHRGACFAFSLPRTIIVAHQRTPTPLGERCAEQARR